MESHSLFSSSFSILFPSFKPKCQLKKPFPTLQPHPQTSLLHSNLKVFNGVRFDGPIIDVKELEEIEDGDFVMETCVVRNLPPALTLEQGLQSIKEAVERLKLSPPCFSGGILRFQVAVPPSAKALNWFCSQAESVGVFPLFYLSKETNDPSCKTLYMNRNRGVFGIGAAVSFTNSSCVSRGQSSIKRYLSNDSTFISTYGFVDINFNTESSSIKHEPGSFYFFIPLIELDEHEDVSTLAVTLAWSDYCSRTFEQAIVSFESALYQASSHFWPTAERCQTRCIKSALRKLNVNEDKSLQMVYINALSLGLWDFGADSMELRSAPSFCQFAFKLSPSIGVASNMLENGTSYSLQDHANINCVWASLIVEECSRLGLTYFCIAPGSRSSPLALAASTHPLTTCIACIDERSLAFHAVGYARGSNKPAVIITSSGTAVSNLLPAVVEASQDFIPVLLLTADRPPELQDAGANQSINQVSHYGSFVRFFFNLPPPSDEIPARMVLTTLDSAVHWATSSPMGPVHINCPFREPLDGSPEVWISSCLKGLDIWMSNAEPFTKYIQVRHSPESIIDTHGIITEVVEIIQGVNRGLLLVGAIHTEDEIWAALLLAKHLRWPVVADILSGLRLRNHLSSFPEIEGNILYVDFLDHILLSDSVRGWLQFEVIIQIGSRITSKRISQMLEEYLPCPYILVDSHPSRHDPLHFVTHRIQGTVTQFASILLKAPFPHRSSKWFDYLQALNMMVAQEISFQVRAEHSLSEPYVAHVLSKALSSESALFIGNSMVIRDVDMYGCNCSDDSHSFADKMLNSGLSGNWIRVAGNRGASGIDGLLSTAIGFAVGSNKQVLCVVGDVSFLHDTNGLAIMNQRILRKPMTILVINNHGGAIFSLLPIAARAEPRVLDQFFYASHNVSIQQLCMAHGVKHLKVKTKMELQDVLFSLKHSGTDCVIEVESSINTNAVFHSKLREFARQAADHALGILLRLSILQGCFPLEVHKMDYLLYRIQLCAPTTSSYADNDHSIFYREGYILSLTLEDGSIGYGEVAPLQIHEENLQDVEEQLRFILHVIKGAKINYFLPLLRGSFSSWIWNSLGIPAYSLFPSVRCGLEMAILNAFAVSQGSSLLNLLHPQTEREEEICERSLSVQICALIDGSGTPEEVAHTAAKLVEEGYTAIKLKVARRSDPIEDAAVIQEVRRRVGHHIKLRVDANRKWTYEKAIKFGTLVKNCDLQYIEEPVQNDDDIIRYCEESGLPVALDESIDIYQENPHMLMKYAHPGIVALVIKPSVIGGFEKAALIARWAQRQGKMAVVSAAFESSLGLSAYILFSCYLELQNADVCKVMNRDVAPSVAHGLGTYRWLKEDVTKDPLGICCNPHTGFMEASVADATQLLQKFQINHDSVHRTFTGEELLSYQLTVDSNDFSCSLNVQEIGQRSNETILFIHGFLGTGEDWIPVMHSLSGSVRCVSVDLPGHGGTKMYNHDYKGATWEPTLSIEIVADVLFKLIECIAPRNVTLVGYSMGARIALYMALKFRDKIEGAVIVSGSPGLKDMVGRKIRRAKDDSSACSLLAHGLQHFLNTWYAGDLWKSLRSHPHFCQIVARRSHGDARSLAKVLSDLSTGRQLPLWEDLKNFQKTLLFVVGEKDEKFKSIAHKIVEENNLHEVFEVPNCGHAVHLENPLPLVRAIRQYMARLKKNKFSIRDEEMP